MSSPAPPDPYKTLGVPKDATLPTIRSAHRKLVLTCHPDKFPDESVKAQKADEFHKVQQAYELLSDEQRRAKYDDKCRLAELKAEVMKENANARKAAGAYDYSPRTPRTGYWEQRREPVVEIRPRYYTTEEHPPPQPPRPSPRYDDHDYRSRRYEDIYDIPVSSSSSKKASGSRAYKEEVRHEEDKSSRLRGKWKNVAAKVTSDKYREQEDRRKSRDKDRRQEYQSKHYYSSPRVESDSDSDSVEDFMQARRSTETKRRYEEPSRRSKREDDYRRRRTDEESESSDAPEPKTEHKVKHNVASAAEYILKTRVKAHSERDGNHRPAVTRTSSSRVSPPPAAPPPPASVTGVDTSARRSSARRGAMSTSKSSPKERKLPEIVEAAPTPSPRRTEHNTSHRPNLAASATSPLATKGPPTISNIARAATMETHASEKHPSMRRAQTSPLQTVTSPSAHAPHKSSKLREAHDSGYSSPGSPDTPVPPPSNNYKTSRYRVQEPDSDDSDVSRPTVVAIDPEARRRGNRDVSPRTPPYRYDHRSATDPRASSRTAPNRAATWGDERSPPQAPPLNRASTGLENSTSGRRPLYGEIGSPDGRGANVRSPRDEYHVRYSPQIVKDNISYGEYLPRRGRGDSRTEDKDRDAYAYERNGRHGQSPGLGERQGSRRAEVPSY